MKLTTTLIAALTAGLLTHVAGASADTIVKDDNTDALNETTSWVGGVVPGSTDIAQWDATVTGSQTLTLGAAQSWFGINFVSGLGGNVTFNSGNTLSVGAAGISNNANRTYSFSNTVLLTADQAWYMSTGLLVTNTAVDTAGYALHLTGGGSGTRYQFKADIIGGGDVLIDGPVKFSGGASAPDSALRLVGNTLNFDDPSGLASGDRAKSLVLEGGALSVSGRNNTNSNDSFTDSITVQSGNSIVAINPVGTANAVVSAPDFIRNAGGTVLFRGANLGLNTIASQTAGAANVVFTNAPALNGAGGLAGTTTLSILKGAYGDTTTDSGFGATGGLVTYDVDNGVRLLTASEYKTSIDDGQTQLDNVLLTNSSGSALNVTLDSNTTINSLSLKVDATTSPITLDGAGTLKLASGVLYAYTVSPAVAGSEIMIHNAIDLNGSEGVILFSTNGSSNGTGGALLRIYGAITNDGGNGLTISGNTGVLELDGPDASTYTGVTTVNGGTVRLLKDSSNIGIPGDLVINGGAVQNPGNQIPDTSNITINGGTLYQKGGALNSGSGAYETFNNLTMNGGSFGDGASGTSSGVTNLNNADMHGGNWSVTNGHKTYLAGNLTMDGGTMGIGRANDTSRKTVVTVTGDISLTNISAGAYTPISLTGGSSVGVDGGQLALGGNLYFTGDAINDNTVTINAGDPTNGGGIGTLVLDGAHTFNIGDGAAATDLTVVPIIIDGSSAGSLTKTGAGTLALLGANTYTGDTVIAAGTLALGATGSLASADIAINAGAAFDTTGQSFVMNGSQIVQWTIDPTGLGLAGLLNADALDITGASVDFATLATLDDPAYILAAYTALTGSAFDVVTNLPAGYVLDYNYAGGSQIALVSTAIPEPATLALLGLGGLMLASRRRRA